MRLFSKKKKKNIERGARKSLNAEEIKRLMVAIGQVKIASEEDEKVRRLYELAKDRNAKNGEILKVWREVMRRGERVFRIMDIGLKFRRFADGIRYDNEGREIRGKGIYVVVGATDEEVYAGYGEGLKELRGEEPKYPYTGTGFAMTSDGSIVPELYLKKSYDPLFIFVEKIRGDGVSEGGYFIVMQSGKSG